MIVLRFLGAIIIAIFTIFVALLFRGIDRKVAARLQGRFGPPILQPFWDVVKLMGKENTVPKNAVRWLFNGAPIIGLVTAITVLFYIPYGSWGPVFGPYGDVILVLYLLTIPALSMVIGGFASGSPYATVGAQREMVMMMSYEFPLALSIIGIGWGISTFYTKGAIFTLGTIVSNPLWGHLGPLGVSGLFLLLVTMFSVVPAELSKIPFDAPEAETEIAEGVLVEYSGRNLAVFYLTDALKAFIVASLVVVLFFPYGLGVGGFIGQILDFLFFFVKVLVVMLINVTLVRVAFSRLKIDQVSYGYLVLISFIGLIGILLIYLDKIAG